MQFITRGADALHHGATMTNTRRFLAVVLVAVAPSAFAQALTAIDVEVRNVEAASTHRGSAQVAQKIASGFTTLAGSQENALKLVNGLREGRGVSLEGKSGDLTTITPATGRMGWGEVRIALAIARDTLMRAGIQQPTHAELDAALNGGAVSARGMGRPGTVALRGVLQMRMDGMSWSQIAHASGVRAGAAVTDLRELQRHVSASADADGATH